MAVSGSTPYGGRGPEILIVTWIETAIACIMMGARLYVNLRLTRQLRADWWWALTTLIISLFAQVALTISVAWGTGNDADLLTPHQQTLAIEWNWIGQIVTLLSTGFGKMAIIYFLLRIQERTHKKSAWFLHFTGWSNMVLNFIQVVLILLQCSPTPKLWNNSLKGTCNEKQRTNTAGYFRGAYSAFGDLVLAVYPIFIFWSLKMALRFKIGLCLLLGGGVITTACAITKTVYIKLITAENNKTYAITPLLLWAYSEMWAILILGTIPTLRPLFIHGFRRLRAKQQGYSSSSGDRSKSNSTPLDPLSISGISSTLRSSNKHQSSNARPPLSGGYPPISSESIEKILPPENQRQGDIWTTMRVDVRSGSANGEQNGNLRAEELAEAEFGAPHAMSSHQAQAYVSTRV